MDICSIKTKNEIWQYDLLLIKNDKNEHIPHEGHLIKDLTKFAHFRKLATLTQVEGETIFEDLCVAFCHTNYIAGLNQLAKLVPSETEKMIDWWIGTTTSFKIKQK
jgi:hypothetical protein